MCYIGWTVQNILSVTDWQAYAWNDVSEEVIDSKILAVLFSKKPDICLRHNRRWRIASFWPRGLSSNAQFHVQIQDTDYRSIDTMTPNKLAIYFVADMVVADMVALPRFACGGVSSGRLSSGWN